MFMVNQLAGFGVGGDGDLGVPYVGGSAVTESSTPSWPVGTQVDDLAVILAVGNSAASGGGYTWLSSTAFSAHVATPGYKVLTSGNVSSPPSFTVPSHGSYVTLVFRRATTLVEKTKTYGSGSSVSVAGFTPQDVGHVLAWGVSRNPSEPSTVTGWVDALVGGISTYFGHQVSLRESKDYSGSVTVPIGGSGQASYGFLLEVT